MSFFKKLFGKKQEEKKEEPIIQEVSIQEEKVEDEAEAIEEIASQEALEQEEAQRALEEVKIAEEKQEEAQRALEEARIAREKQEEAQRELEEARIAREKQEEAQRALEEARIDREKQEEAKQAKEEDSSNEEVIKAKKEELIEDSKATQEVVLESIEEQKTKKKGLFSKLFSGLAKTRDNILGSVDDVLKNFKKIDEELYEELEEALIMADFGVDTTLKIMDDLRKIVKERKITEPSELKVAIQEIITDILTAHVTTPIIDETKPNVVLVIGVNGVGKTTTIGKLSHQLKTEDKKVVLAAADTFRAAAIEQLQIWADRAGVDLIKQQEGSDPASVVYDGIKAAKSRQADVLICDTAGRLQNKTNLMKELEKISRIIDREYPEAHKEVLIVLDATTGQNAISQVKVFKETAKVDGIILTKLDGTAKGGAIVGICQSMGVPVKYIGVGEKIEDLQVFDPQNFARALFNIE